MRIGYYLADQNPHRDRSLGITAYSAALLEQLSTRPAFTTVALSSQSSFCPASAHEKQLLPFRTDHPCGRLAADQLHPLLSRPIVDLWHYPKGFLPSRMRYAQPVAGTICDTILQYYADHHPHYRSRAAYAYWISVLKRSIRRFDAILTISEHSKQQILALAERYSIRCPPITVTYLSTNWQVAPVREKENFVLHLASREPHKQTSALLGFWGELERHGGHNTMLELVGSMNPADQVAAQSLKTVRISPRLSAVEFQQRFGKARALILSSEVEGFGLPALESYAAGTPVVYVRKTAVEEILGTDTPGGFVLSSFESFQAGLQEALSMDSLSIAAKRQILTNKFSWSRCADETTTVYAGVL